MATKKTTAKKAPVVKSKEELSAELVTTQSELVDARRSHAARELANTTRISELRRNIARIKTALRAAANEEEKA